MEAFLNRLRTIVCTVTEKIDPFEVRVRIVNGKEPERRAQESRRRRHRGRCPHGERVWGDGPPQKFFFDFRPQNGIFWRILGVIFYNSAAFFMHRIRLYWG